MSPAPTRRYRPRWRRNDLSRSIWAFSRGIGMSKQRELFLPESYSDFIFAIVGEEYGFIGAIVILLLGILVPGVVKMVVLSLLLAYIFDPIVTMIELRGLSRTGSTLLFFAFLSSIAWILFALRPA